MALETHSCFGVYYNRHVFRDSFGHYYYYYYYYYRRALYNKDKYNVSCEVEDFVETHLCKLCGILRSRVLRVLCDLIKDVSPY